MRVDDRRQLHELRERIERVLGDPAAAAEAERQRLWEDLDAFSRLLMAVHQREDLRSHDRELVTEVRQEAGRGATVATPLLRRLAPLLGLDDELDAALVDPGGRAVGLEVLERVERQLRPLVGW
jgi:hypothetical protein